MSGILDSKSRIIDAILTVEGKRQMAEGLFEVKYVTFSDLGVPYVPDPESGHEDPTGKIYFEACNLPQDQITFEANDEGKIMPFRNQDIKVAIPSVSTTNATIGGSLRDGKLTAYQYYHGRRVKCNRIFENFSDLGKGFVYTDKLGTSGSILVDPSLTAGGIRVVHTTPSSPYIAYVGSQGGMGPEQFSQAISGAISSLSSLLGGPKVSCSATNGSVYLDYLEPFFGTKIYATGSLSSPLLVEESALGGNLLTEEVQNAAFSSQIQGILTASFDNFSKLQLLSSIDRFFEDQDFVLKRDKTFFDMSKISNTTLSALKNSSPYLNTIDSVFNDERFSHLDNFLYLPPVVKVSNSAVPNKSNIDALKPYLLGDYPSWGDNEKKLNFQKLSTHLSGYESPMEVDFLYTSNNNNVIGQFFEVNGSHATKLDVVDFGRIDNSEGATKSVFFVGKTFLDNRGTSVFVNIFTMVFSNRQQEI